MIKINTFYGHYSSENNSRSRVLSITLKNLYLRGFTKVMRGILFEAFSPKEFVRRLKAFTLVEMLMALLIVSVILSASLPVISVRTKSQSMNSSKYSSVPIGMIAMWKADGALPDNTWLEANGQVIPNGIEYEQCRRIYGSRLPDLRGADSEFYTSLNNYLSKDIKDYLQSAIKPLPKDLVAIWGTTAAIPEGWSEASEYRGVFLRGYGSLTHTQNNGSIVGNTATTHSSGAIGAVQGDTARNLTGWMGSYTNYYHHNIWGEGYLISYGGIFFGDNYFLQEAIDGMGDRWEKAMGAGVIRFDASRVIPTSNEIRPINKAVKYIKYTDSSTLPNIPAPPQYVQKFRYIVKVKH